MSDFIVFKKKISKFKKTISVSGDKSISIRWVLFSSIANGVSRAKNLLLSEDVLAAINTIKKFGNKSKVSHEGPYVVLEVLEHELVCVGEEGREKKFSKSLLTLDNFLF